MACRQHEVVPRPIRCFAIDELAAAIRGASGLIDTHGALLESLRKRRDGLDRGMLLGRRGPLGHEAQAMDVSVR